MMNRGLKPALSFEKIKILCQKWAFRIIGGGMLALSACTPTITSVCPPIQQYSFQFNQSLATEIEALPDNSLIPRVVSDYINLRDQLKLCKGK